MGATTIRLARRVLPNSIGLNRRLIFLTLKTLGNSVVTEGVVSDYVFRAQWSGEVATTVCAVCMRQFYVSILVMSPPRELLRLFASQMDGKAQDCLKKTVN